MPPTLSYLLDVSFIELCIFYLVYIIYGRATKKPLVGDYKPGDIGYANFKKLIYSTRLIVIIIAVFLFFIVSAVFDALQILKQPGGLSTLIITPVLIGAGLLLLIGILPKLLKGNTKS